MRDTLYVSDLDGTLLRPDGTLSPYTIEVVAKFVRAGGKFTIATGRSWPMARPIIEQLELPLPVALNNGVLLYHPANRSYERVHRLSEQAVGFLLERFRELEVSGFFYLLENGETRVLYPPLRRASERAYRENRLRLYPAGFAECGDILGTLADGLPHICVTYGSREEMVSLQKALESPLLTTALSSDVYTPDVCFLDIQPAGTSKAAAMWEIATLAGAERSVAFGDNHNDSSMLEAADESYVTANGEEDLKRAATAVIGSCGEDGVAKFLAERFGL